MILLTSGRYGSPLLAIGFYSFWGGYLHPPQEKLPLEIKTPTPPPPKKKKSFNKLNGYLR